MRIQTLELPLDTSGPTATADFVLIFDEVPGGNLDMPGLAEKVGAKAVLAFEDRVDVVER